MGGVGFCVLSLGESDDFPFRRVRFVIVMHLTEIYEFELAKGSSHALHGYM